MVYIALIWKSCSNVSGQVDDLEDESDISDTKAENEAEDADNF